MKPEVKIWINRGGLIAIIVGLVVYFATGGGVETAGQLVSVVGGVTGAVLILIRELFG